MAFYSGMATSITDLSTALVNACIAEGWNWSNSILNKGTSYFEITNSSTALFVLGGTDKSAGNLVGFPSITTSSNTQYYKLKACLIGIRTALSYPLNYSIHIFNNPDEVYLIVNYQVDKYSFLSFGQFKQILTGTGNWFFGVGGTNNPSYLSPSTSLSGGTFSGNITSIIPFSLNYSSGTVGNTENNFNSYVHHGLDSATWSLLGGDVGNPTEKNILASTSSQANAWNAQSTLINIQPSTWNSEAILLPISPTIYRASKKVTILGTLENARYMRIDHFEPQQVLTIGNEKWKVYPFYKKNITARNGGNDVDHTGTFGWAIRYDGP